MNIGRNDPCPCGSGRKYKSCCMARDAARGRESETGDTTSLRDVRGLQEARRHAARTETVWEADVIPVMARFEDGQSPRPVIVIITAGDMIIHHDMRGRLRGGAQAVAELVERELAKAAREVGVYPERLRVRHPDVAGALAPLLAPRQLEVESGELQHLAEVGGQMIEAVMGVHMWPPVCRPDTWSAWDLPAALVKELFAAAAKFYRLAPWRDVSNLQAPRALLRAGRSWTCCVLGNAGEEFGLVLYENASDLFDVVASGNTPEEPFAGIRGRVISVTFISGKEAGSDALREARLGHWEVAGPAAYPQLMTVNTPGGGVTADEIADMITLFDAVPRFVQANRHALAREEETGDPSDDMAWRDATSGIVFQYAGEAAWYMLGEDDETEDWRSDLRAELRDDLPAAFRAAVEEAGEDADDAAVLAALNRRLQQGTAAYNEQPQPDLGGLSPVQVQRLLDAKWNTPGGAVQLRNDLSLDDVAHVDLLANARTLLSLAVEHGGFGLTQAGNLKLDMVAELLSRMQLDPEYLSIVHRPGTRLKEQDLWPLHKLRVVCKLAGLLKRRGQRLEATHAARRLIKPERAGELHVLLFQTWFRKFNIGYGTRGHWPELQHQVAYTLYRLQSVAPAWRSAEDLLDDVVLPYALERAPRYGEMATSLARVDLQVLVLDTLVDFGLLIRRNVDSAGQRHREYMTTVLMVQFLRFEL